MALVLTDKINTLSQGTNVILNVILEIEGIDLKFGTLPIEIELRLDEGHRLDTSLRFDQPIEDENSRSYISLDSSTNRITQNLSIDKGIESLRTFKVALVDKQEELSQLFTPGNTIDDILGRKAKVFLSLKPSTHPVDSVQIMEGIIAECSFTNKGTVDLLVSHASQFKRQIIYTPKTSKLNGAIDSSTTSISLDDFSEFLLPVSNALRTFIRVEDEIIEYTAKNGDALSGTITRGALNSFATSHDDDAEVTSYYGFIGDAPSIACRLMTSTSGYATQETFLHTNFVDQTLTVPNAIVFNKTDIEKEYGLVTGDHVQITGTSNNNITSTISSFGSANGYSYIIITDTLTQEINLTGAVAKFKSKHDILPEGSGMNGQQVDVFKHDDFLSLFSAQFPELLIKVEEEIKIDEFLNEQVYKPMGMYSVSGNKSSVQMTIPPLADIYTKTLDETNVLNPTSIAIKRSINQYFYNSIIFKYDKDTVKDKYYKSLVTIDADSNSRIPTGNKIFLVTSDGLQNNAETNTSLGITSRRFLDRYKFAGETLSLQTTFSNFTIETGDAVILDGLQITDTTNQGSKTFGPRIFEVIKKDLSLKTGVLSLQLLSTNYGLEQRYGVISPSSKIDSGATTAVIPIKNSFGWTRVEQEKWADLTGATVRISNSDFSYDETCLLNGFDPTSQNKMLVQNLASAPPADAVIQISEYPSTTDRISKLVKGLYCFMNKHLPITAGNSNTEFTIDSSNVGHLNENDVVEIHDGEFGDLVTATISSVTSGGVVTVKDDLGFTPTSAYRIDLVKFKEDSKEPYGVI